ncbi:2-pyrone-4,6-dicarboxylate hydrolase [bacterium M00.F.Ca.ET.228.01.1.1]|uniref:amidohydrolase family protein n=1 Tax=Paraburkholderia phenoliruptrix TaxID=252970 RepID=UPI001092517C|nr:amidohydrolase family protein [Paraburkholderia phenoliruptrix]TGP46047.1 2-pyrone-4,6-dicarboxylate hydrolase [bacterium M00.F.Ca.ET.228.01.1.1]TGS04041.1 2-pyrone-4,6-dicarboxylate hydrolase [bacterium M00.F.Ca.ET.191.01.1.1]TGU07340.1 2-pyrone-4,6-dicarboxylate hydrolase [bacterium M00.F.Ca.ET.155.01.1.1]MBW0446581.1 amidohydrolase family protein [Paraburkholderia phenoliruptrix]MBW9096992.1 amidohydrolase family protein [Paraburkholderia phenoliruptrix]
MTPFSAGECRPTVVLPDNSCDCHMHVFDDTRLPVAGATVTPPTATVNDYRKLQERLGTRRHVLVQPSTYGTDNSLMVSTLVENRTNARGVAVVNDKVSDEELVALNDAGVVGIRFNQVQAGATSLAMLESLAPRIQTLGWHIQLHVTGQQLIDYAELLLRPGVPLVLDHYARLHHVPSLANAVTERLMRLMDSGRVWLKLSAPYLSSQATHPPYIDLGHSLESLTRNFPERLVWGSDWPHATEADKPDDAQMLDWLTSQIPSHKLQESVFVENAASLYRFQVAREAL